MAMKEYSAFPKAPALMEPSYQSVQCHIWDTQMQSVYSTASAVVIWYFESIFHDPFWYLVDALLNFSFYGSHMFGAVTIEEVITDLWRETGYYFINFDYE